MVNILLLSVLMLLAYLMGSMNFGIVLCKLFKYPDPRGQGSKNPGATNVLRVAGKPIAFATLIGDFIKGMLPILFAQWCGLSPFAQAWIGMAAFLGHLYPIFFQFHGGKGVATGAGVVLMLAWPVGLCALTIWLLVTLFSRYVSLGSIIASLSLPLLAYAFGHSPLVLVFTLIGLFTIYRHRNNLALLLKGKERKLSFSK